MSKSLSLWLIAILILLLTGIGFYFFQANNQLQLQPIASPTPTPIPSALKFSVENQKVLVGVPLVLEVLADSNFQDVVGYDVIVGYDVEAFTFRQAVPTNTSYQLFNTTSPKSDHISLTAVKRLTVQDKITFSNQALLALTFTPTKKGRYTFQIIPQVGAEKTKLVNDKIQVSQPRVETVTVEVE